MILYIENPTDTTRKLLEQINKYSKVEGYKINTQKSLAFLYTNNEKAEREIKGTIPFTIAMKIVKYLGIDLPKETKDLYIQNYKTLVKEIRGHKQMEKYTMFINWKSQYSENEYTTQSNLQIQCNPYQATNGIFHRTRTNNFTICMEILKNLEQPKQSRERRMEMKESTCLTSDYTTKLQSSRQYGTGTKTEIQINGTKQKAQR